MRNELRPITVQGRRFRWRFGGRLVVVPDGRSGPPLYVDWGWEDWLQPGGPGLDPRIVTPGFVAGSVAFALGRGWSLDGRGTPLVLGYMDGTFHEGPPR